MITELRSGAGVLALAAGIAAAAPAGASVTISTGATENVSCSAGLCAPTAADAVLNVGDLENLLASGNVEVTTTGSGVQAKDIVVKAALSWSTTNALDFDAYESITVDQPVSVEGVSGLTLATNDGGRNGELSFGPKGNITFADLSSSLTIDGAAYTLVNTVQGLASAIAANPNGAFALAADYSAAHDGTYTQAPVSTFFYGIFEGLGNSISHLKFGSSSGGFFLLVDTGSEVRDFVLSDMKARNKGGFGGLASDNYGLIAHCGVSGSIVETSDKDSYIAGLIAFNAGTISDSWASIAITAQRTGIAGGLVSFNGGFPVEGGTIERSWATGSITIQTKRTKGHQNMGGLVGASDPGSTIVDSYADVSLSPAAAMGLVYWAGGLVGLNQGDAIASYSTGSVGSGDVSGLIGGLIGYDQSAGGSLSDTYWDTTTSGIINLSQGAGDPANDPGITGLTSQQLQSGLPAGFDPRVWGENPKINHGMPYLISNPPRKQAARKTGRIGIQ